VSISPCFSYTFEGLIFRILPDNTLPFLALEVRHLQDKEVTFAVIDYQKGTLLFDGLGLEESWWVGIAGFSQGQLFFHHFADKEYPSAQGLMVANVMSQALLWEKKGVYLEEITPQGVWVSYLESEQKEYYLLDTATGNLLKEINNFNEVSDSAILNKNPIFPSQYEENSPYFIMVSQFLVQRLDVLPKGQIDYCEFKDRIVIAYLSNNQKFLLILDIEGGILFHQIILEDASGVGTDSFFIIDECLVCIAKRNTLLLFNL
jgi:hypothetical protein